MSFSWSETITAKIVKIKASHFVELHTNINVDRAQVGLGDYVFGKIPNQKTDEIEPTDVSKLRTALDEAYDENCCQTVNAGQHLTYYSGVDSGVNAGHNTGVNTGVDTTVNEVHYGTIHMAY